MKNYSFYILNTVYHLCFKMGFCFLLALFLALSGMEFRYLCVSGESTLTATPLARTSPLLCSKDMGLRIHLAYSTALTMSLTHHCKASRSLQLTMECWEIISCQIFLGVDYKNICWKLKLAGSSETLETFLLSRWDPPGVRAAHTQDHLLRGLPCWVLWVRSVSLCLGSLARVCNQVSHPKGSWHLPAGS